MKIAIFHLSDVHFKSQNDWVIKRIPLLEKAIHPIVEAVSSCFVIVTGDIAFSGREDEYDVAYSALNSFRQSLTDKYPSVRIELILVPGNHDCDFTREDSVRVALLGSGPRILDQLKRDDDSIVKAVLQTQDHFFEFVARVEGSPLLTGYDRLTYRRQFLVDGKKVRFDCYNTAWVSRKNEKPAELIFPSELVEDSDRNDDFVVAAFHHPTQWLEPNNARLFRSRIEYQANLILTGHEHVPDQYTKHHLLTGEVSLYLEGAVLQGTNPRESGFNAIEIDLTKNEKRLTEFSWRRDMYVPSKHDEWTNIEKAANQRDSKFENNETYRRDLLDPGANFSHKSRRLIQLSDIYVYPELTMMPFEKNSSAKALPIVDSEKVFEFVLNHPRLIVAGGDASGKSAFARTIYVDLLSHGLVPIMLHSSDIKSTSQRDLTRLIDRQIEEQYNSDSVIRYGQLRKDLRILLIDDFHKIANLNRKGRNVVVEAAEARFGRVILLVDSLFEFQETAEPSSEQSNLMRFTHVELSEFGHRLRYQLISKWIKLGQEYTGDEEEIRHRINETTDIVTTLLGRKVVPKYPIFILSMLQALDTDTNLNTASGAFGYFYEVFILQSLSLHRTQKITMDTVTTFLTLVAYRMFELRQLSLTAGEWDSVTDLYFGDYGLRFDREGMIKILEASKVMQRRGDTIAFNYKYVYYYFVAKYLATSLGSLSKQKHARELIATMTNNLGVQAYTNIIVFLVYLTKDELTIAEILKRVREQYSDIEPLDLYARTNFLNDLQLDTPKPALSDGDADSNKDAHLREMDDAERNWGDAREDTTDEEYMERKVDDSSRLEVAVKALQIAGQILRNFPGALPRKEKLDLTRESHFLGLRLMNLMFSLLDRNKERFRFQFGSFLKQLKPDLEDTEVSRQADVMLFALGGGMLYGLVKMIAASIGSEHLRETYAETLKDAPDIPTRLVDLVIKLEHFRPFPEKDVEQLEQEVVKNKLSLMVLRLLIRDHFHVEREDYKLRQRVCSNIGIDFRDYQMIEDKHKR